MTEFDVTKITTIIAVCAIISPVLTTIINVCHQLAVKTMDNAEKRREQTSGHKRKVVEDYLRHVGNVIYYPCPENRKDYGQAYTIALLYVTEEIRSEMVDIDELLDKNTFIAQTRLTLLIPKLEEMLGKL